MPDGDAVTFQSPTTGAIQPVPSEHWDEALSQGYKPASHKIMYSPTGQRGMVPNEQLRSFMQQGYQSTPQTQFEKDRTPEGPAFLRFLSGAADSAKGIAGGLANTPTNPADAAVAGGKLGAQVGQEDVQRKEEGRSLPYRGVVAVGSGLGINARGMEEAANRGDSANILGQAAASTAAATAPSVASRAVPWAAGKIPSFERAGRSFQEVMGAAKANPVQTTNALSDSIMQYRKLVDAGGARSMSVEKLLQRLTNPDKGPLTYEEARDFGSNISRLSADESQRLTPVMKRSVGQIAKNLTATTADTATQAGKGPQFKSAMKEYAQASRLEDFKDVLKGSAVNAAKYGVPSAIGGTAAGYVVKKVLNQK